MKKVLVVAPHPDDETLGCGGTLLRHKCEGCELHWIIATSMTAEGGFSQDCIDKRNKEIEAVAENYGMTGIYHLGFPTTSLDRLPLGEIIEKMGKIFMEVKPEIVYVPYPGDIHSDHQVIFQAVAGLTKWFRYPFIKKVLACEILSETDFQIDPSRNRFSPNVFVDISSYLEKKIEIMEIFQGETASFPFPRSREAIVSQARFRGAQCGQRASEAFLLLKEIL